MHWDADASKLFSFFFWFLYAEIEKCRTFFYRCHLSTSQAQLVLDNAFRLWGEKQDRVAFGCVTLFTGGFLFGIVTVKGLFRCIQNTALAVWGKSMRSRNNFSYFSFVIKFGAEEIICGAISVRIHVPEAFCLFFIPLFYQWKHSIFR